MAKIKIPVPLRTYTQSAAEVTVPGSSVGEIVKGLDSQYPGLGARLLDDKGAVRRYINIYHNDEDIRALQQLETPVTDADTLIIMPAIAGG